MLTHRYGESSTAETLHPADQLRDLYRTRYLDLVRLATQLVDDRGVAEEVVQDVFAALQGATRLPDDPVRYLRTAVLNRARSVLRRRHVAQRVLPWRQAHGEPADAATLRRDEQDRVVAAVARLPHRQREVVVLRFYEDLDVGEIASLLGITAGAVSSSLHRAVTALGTLLGDTSE